MRFDIQKALTKFDKEHKRRSKWYKIVSALAAVVVFCTVYALILPAITLENDQASENGVYTEGAAEENTSVVSEDAAVEEPATAEEQSEETADEETAADSEVTAAAEDEEQAADEKAAAKADADEEQTADDNSGEKSADADEGSEEASEAMTFTRSTADKKVTVKVEAEAGAFPEGTTMKVEAVAENKIIDAIEEAIDDEEKVESVKAVDITFYNKDGKEIEPAAGRTVNVTIMSSEIADAQDPVIVHVKENNGSQKGEIVKDVDTDKQESGDLSFETDSFSVYAIVDTAPGYEITMNVGSTETIEPEYKKTYKNFEWETSDSSVISIVSGADSADVTVKAEAEGTAQLTLTYSGNGNKEYHAYYSITAAVLSDADSSAQEYTNDGMTVTVKETGNLKKLSGYDVVVEDADAEFEDEVDLLKAYHIYLADEEGNEVDSDELGNGKLNLKVTIAYETAPEWFEEAGTVKHFKDGEEQSISSVKIDEEKNEISFIVHGFSEFTISSGSSATTSSGVAVTTQEGSILDGRTFDDANEWQIVAEEYTDNAAANKTNYGNDSYNFVRVQKSIIPTETENEFYVYLSIDTKDLLREWLKYATYYKCSQNNYHDASLGEVVTSMPSHDSSFTANPDAGYAWYTNVDVVDSNGNVILENLPIYSSQNQNNTTVFLDLGNSRYVLFGVSVDKGVTDPTNVADNKCMLGEEAMQIINELIGNVLSLNYVTDTMGDNIEFVEVVSGDYATVPTCTDGVLTWIPVMKSDPTTVTQSAGSNLYVTWDMNAAELLYKVRLDVTAEGFNSCAQNMDSDTGDDESYKVNKSAVLNYDINLNGSTQTGKTATFQIPYVRGLLYDVVGKKVDENGNLLKDAVFSLTGTDVYDTAISETITSTDTAYNTASGSNLYYTGLAAAKDSASYVLTETRAPSGYKIATSAKTAYLNYTNNKSSLTASSLDSTHMMMQNSPTAYTFTNTANKITVTKVWADEEDHSGDSVTVTLTASDATVSISDATQILNSNNGWTYTWSNLPQYDSAGSQITYTVTEDSVNASLPYTATVTCEGSDGFYACTGDLSFTVTNTPVSYKVTLTKVDQEDETLTGATLTMGSFNLSTVTSNGTADLGDSAVLNTEYTLSETIAPEGYILLPYPITFKIAADSSAEGGYKLVYIDGDTDTNEKLTLSVTAATETDPLTLNLYLANDQGAELPATGGPGTLIYTFGGILLMAGAALMYSLRTKSAERRSN